VVVLGIAFLVGCAGLPVVTRPYGPGKILILPPRDVVQGGVPHPKGMGSGRMLMHAVMGRLGGTSFETITTRSKAFNHRTIASKEAALQEAKRLNADYCLQLVLGEFRNAAPMSFRSDYVYLSQGVMFDVATGQEVWRLRSPLYRQKENIGNHLPLIHQIARIVADSIVKQAGQGAR
jgi:hypothetical protein